MSVLVVLQSENISTHNGLVISDNVLLADTVLKSWNNPSQSERKVEVEELKMEDGILQASSTVELQFFRRK